MFYFGEHTKSAICLAFLLFVIFLKKSLSKSNEQTILEKHFRPTFSCASFRFACFSFLYFTAISGEFLCNMWYFATKISSFVVCVYFCHCFCHFVSTQIQSHLHRPAFVCRLFKHEIAIRSPYFSKLFHVIWSNHCKHKTSAFHFNRLTTTTTSILLGTTWNLWTSKRSWRGSYFSNIRVLKFVYSNAKIKKNITQT